MNASTFTGHSEYGARLGAETVGAETVGAETVGGTTAGRSMEQPAAVMAMAANNVATIAITGSRAR